MLTHNNVGLQRRFTFCRATLRGWNKKAPAYLSIMAIGDSRMHLNVRAVVATLMLSMAMPVAAREPTCAGISDRQAGAACHTQVRRGYGATLERALFRQATSADGNVFVQEMGDPGSGLFPRLVIWTTLLSEDKMNELIAKGAILDGARKVGFRLLVFVDKGQDRNWYFDLTKPANTPLDVVSPPSPAWMMRSSR